MANYQLGPVIGQLGGGGAEVQKIPVNITASGRSDSGVTMHTAHVPEGETWLIALSGDLNPNYTNHNGPVLRIGEESIGPSLPQGRVRLVAWVTGTAEITIKRNTSIGSDRFVGQIYVIPLPA